MKVPWPLRRLWYRLAHPVREWFNPTPPRERQPAHEARLHFERHGKPTDLTLMVEGAPRITIPVYVGGASAMFLAEDSLFPADPDRAMFAALVFRPTQRRHSVPGKPLIIEYEQVPANA